MKYIKEYKVYESSKEEVPYSIINNFEYSELFGIGSMSNRVPFSLSEKKILMDQIHAFDPHDKIVKKANEYQIQLNISEDQKNVIAYNIYKVNDEWFLVSELYRHIAFGPDKGTNWKCDQFDGLLEFLKFKKIIK